MTLDLGTILGLLGAAVGVGLLAFLRVRRTPIGTRRERELVVAGQKKVDAINKKAAEARQSVEDEQAKSHASDPSDTLRGMIEKGEVDR